MNSFDRTEGKYKHPLQEPIVIQVHSQKPSLNQTQANAVKSQDKCLIYCNEFSTSAFFTSLNCKHTFCRQCYEAYIESRMESFDVLSIKCPQEGCTETLSDTSIKEVLEEDRYTRYLELVLLKMVHRTSSSQLCPKPGCARPIKMSYNKNKNKDITCECEAQICKECFYFSHPRKSCLENLDVVFESYMQANNIRFCMMCKTPVIRIDGCTSMTCCVCDYEWCWTCGKHRDSHHNCTNSWDPAVPHIYEKGPSLQKLGSKVKRIFQAVAFPFKCLGRIIFFPFSITKKARVERDDLPPPEGFEVFCEYVTAGAVSLILLPITLVGGTIALLCDISGLIREIKRQYYPASNPPTKRWTTGGIGEFGYVSTRGPDVGNQPESQAPRVSEGNGHNLT